MNTATPGKRGLNRAWEIQESGNQKRFVGHYMTVIRKRTPNSDSQIYYQVHLWDLNTDTHYYATHLGSPRMVYWLLWKKEYSLVEPEGLEAPLLLTERNARALVMREITRRNT